MCPSLLTYSTLLFTVCSSAVISFESPILIPFLVRYAQESMLTSPFMQAHPLFSIDGAHNVFIETLKRGEDDIFGSDSDSAPTVVLRIYEALGGHAQAFLRINGAFGIAKAYSANLLEDNLEELAITRVKDDESDIEVKLNFRGFEVKTVKLVLSDVNAPQGMQDQEECVFNQAN